MAPCPFVNLGRTLSNSNAIRSCRYTLPEPRLTLWEKGFICHTAFAIWIVVAASVNVLKLFLKTENYKALNLWILTNTDISTNTRHRYHDINLLVGGTNEADRNLGVACRLVATFQVLVTCTFSVAVRACWFPLAPLGAPVGHPLRYFRARRVFEGLLQDKCRSRSNNCGYVVHYFWIFFRTGWRRLDPASQRNEAIYTFVCNEAKRLFLLHNTPSLT